MKAIEEKAKRYDEALERAKEQLNGAKVFDYDNEQIAHDIRTTTYAIFPELKEPEDEEVRKAMIDFFKHEREEGIAVLHYGVNIERMISWLEKQGQVKESLISQHENKTCKESDDSLTSEDDNIKKGIRSIFEHYKESGEVVCPYPFVSIEDCLAWLEKQDNTNEIINRDEFAQGVLRGAAINLITWIDYNSAEGNMCLSNMECKDIEDALIHADWNKIYAYLKKKLEKQGEQKHKFNIGDIVSNGQVVYRVDDITKNCIGQDCYSLVNVESEENGTRYISLTDSEGKHSNAGEIAFLCELVDKSFEKQGEQKPADKDKPKFKAGDKIISTISNIPYYITEVCNGHYLTDVGCVIMFNAQDNFELFNQKPAWSEEDEMIALSIEQVMNCASLLNIVPEKIYKIRTWLKSLKERYTWKPSESDILLLERIANGKSNPQDFQASLGGLIGQLKKLREE